jgi:hypothetical protein
LAAWVQAVIGDLGRVEPIRWEGIRLESAS